MSSLYTTVGYLALDGVLSVPAAKNVLKAIKSSALRKDATLKKGFELLLERNPKVAAEVSTCLL
jgi:hypothetical protein